MFGKVHSVTNVVAGISRENTNTTAGMSKGKTSFAAYFKSRRLLKHFVFNLPSIINLQ